ncbi:MAG: hypothetical protein CMP84_11390 [Gammaproteobacteria bacterium]|nr:hypothetical protein [Gammaproteobacteria bacterium]
MLKLRELFLFLIVSILVACDPSADDSTALIDRFFTADQSEQESVVIPSLLNLALAGDNVASVFLSEVFVYEYDAIPIGSRAQIESLFLSNNGPNSAALFAYHELDGEPNFQELSDLSMSALDQCFVIPGYWLPLYQTPTINPADFFSIAWRNADQFSQGMEKLKKCADYYNETRWLESELLLRAGEQTSGISGRLSDLDALWQEFLRNSTFNKVADENHPLARTLSPVNQTTELYLDGVFTFPVVDSLDEVIPQLRADALVGDIRASRSLGIYYSGQSRWVGPDFSVGPTQYEKASPWFELAAESDPVSKFYLWQLKFGRADSVEKSQIRQLLIDSIQEGFFIPACMALVSRPEIGEQISEEYEENYSRIEVASALALICRDGYFNQLNLFANEKGADSNQKSLSAAIGLSNPSILNFPRHPIVYFGQDAKSEYIAKGAIAIFVGLFFAYLAFLTFEANPSSRKNKAISLILLLEGYLLLSMFGIGVLPVSLASLGMARMMLSIFPIVMVGLTFAYLMFLSTTETQLGKYSFHPAVRYGLPFFVVIYSTVYFISWGYGIFPFFNGDGLAINFDPRFARFFAALLLGFHVLILGNLLYVFYVERREKAVKAETKFYLAAYSARFFFMTFTLAGIIFITTFQDYVSSATQELLTNTFIAGEAIYGSLFAYGILQGELFGVRRLVKKGLVKLIVILMLFGTYYLIEDLVSENFSDLLGNLAGLCSAALVFAFEKPISKKAFQIIDLVLPDDSIDSDAEEAYRYLYGLAIEDGIITPNERLMLEFTAENLNLSRAQIGIIEASK